VVLRASSWSIPKLSIFLSTSWAEPVEFAKEPRRMPVGPAANREWLFPEFYMDKQDV
jgi:hypothetical protein